MAATTDTDTIPRCRHLVPHLGDQLAGLADKPTFEDCRQRYSATAERLEREGKGRRTASRVGDRDAYWAPTQEVLDEAMRLGFVVRQPLPSARRYVDDHRQRAYELTAEGREVAALARNDQARFTSLVTNRAICRHPYLRAYLQALAEAPIICPVISQGEVGELRARAAGATVALTEGAAAKINSGPTGIICTADDVAAEIRTAVRKRFGDPPAARPGDKALSEAYNDAFAAASVRARGLRLGPTDLGNIRSWTSQWLLTDQSRYVPGFTGANVIWLAADLDSHTESHANGTSVLLNLVGASEAVVPEGSTPDPAEGGSPLEVPVEVVVRRRGLTEHGEAVAKAIVAAYISQGEAAESNLAAPYLAIHAVRAEAAYRCRVTKALVNIVLERLVSGAYPALGVRVHLHLAGAPEPPKSEPVYDRGGARRYAMTLTRRTPEPSRTQPEGAM